MHLDKPIENFLDLDTTFLNVSMSMFEANGINF